MNDSNARRDDMPQNHAVPSSLKGTPCRSALSRKEADCPL
jgi:hypothetical protein